MAGFDSPDDISLQELRMRYRYICAIVVVCFASLVGCTWDSSNAPLPANSVPEGHSDATATPPINGERAPVPSKPKYDAVIVINAAKKGVNGPSCSSDMGPTGKSVCGPTSLLTELSWEFTEHREGADHYRFIWALSVNGTVANTKGLTVGFDGATEATVIDAEHHIVIRRGPLNPDSESAR